jgi:hypothetical protein
MVKIRKGFSKKKANIRYKKPNRGSHKQILGGGKEKVNNSGQENCLIFPDDFS